MTSSNINWITDVLLVSDVILVINARNVKL